MLRALSAASLSRALAGRAGVVAAVTPSSSSNASFSSAAPTYDYRRLKRRSAWFEPDSEDIEKFVFPRVGHGKDWQLNWSLNAVRVTPQNLAYRNLHLAGLHMFSSSPKDAQGRVIIPAGAAKHQSYVVESDEGAASASTGGFSALSQAEGRMVARNVRQHLSSIDRLFVHDGAVGSGEALVLNRAITDSPALAIALSHVMQRARLGSPADFGHEFVTLLAEGASAADIGLGKVSGSFSVFDPQERVLVVGGRPSVGAVVEAQADAANYLLATTPDAAFPLARSHVLATPSGRSVLFGHPEAIVCNELVSAHNAAWGKQGVYRSFGGVVASNTPKNYKYKRGDVVEESGSNSTLTTPHTALQLPCIEHPTGVVFVVNDKNLPAVSKGDAAKGAKLFGEHSPIIGISKEDAVQQFGAMLDNNGTKVFLVNGSKGASQVSKAIIAATNGEV